MRMVVDGNRPCVQDGKLDLLPVNRTGSLVVIRVKTYQSPLVDNMKRTHDTQLLMVLDALDGVPKLMVISPLLIINCIHILENSHTIGRKVCNH